MTAKINAAEATTTRVEEHALRAAQLLKEGVDGQIILNAYGIFIDPRKRRSELRIAREEIDKALALIEATSWPSDADYDD